MSPEMATHIEQAGQGYLDAPRGILCSFPATERKAAAQHVEREIRRRVPVTQFIHKQEVDDIVKRVLDHLLATPF